MKIVRVFPDYMSSGLWNESGAELGVEGFTEVLDDADLMSLRYWHDVWEFLFAPGDPDALDKPSKMSVAYIDQWSIDGKNLVDSWNNKQNVFKFIYKGDYWK